MPGETPFRPSRGGGMKLRRGHTMVWAVSTVTVLGVVPVVLSATAAHASCSTAGCAAPVPCNTSVGACWRPPVATRWQYQLQAARNSNGTGCQYPSTGGINVNISAVPKSGGSAVKPQAFDIDFQTDGFCTGGTITQENAGPCPRSTGTARKPSATS